MKVLPKQYLLGVDNGNTVCKAVLFDVAGNEIEVSGKNLATICPQPGFTERNIENFWEHTAHVIREVIEKAGIQNEQILAVGCTGHGNGIYLLNKQQLLIKAIQSVDLRGIDICNVWKKDGITQKVRCLTQQDLWPAQTSSLLAWIKKNEPELYQQVGSILLCKDYINFCLTGIIASDYTDMSATNLLDIFRRTYSDELLSLYGLEEIKTALPPLLHCSEILGYVNAKAAFETGLLAGTPVVTGMIDVNAGSIGCGMLEENQLNIIAGTWSVNTMVKKSLLTNSPFAMTALFAQPNKWLAIEASATSMTNLEWFVKQFCFEEKQEAIKRGVSVFSICDELVANSESAHTQPVFHPYLQGASGETLARAGWYNLNGWHTKADLLKAVYEGIVFAHYQHIQNLLLDGSSIYQIRLTGGAMRSAYLSQLFADILELPVEIPAGYEAGAKGAAIAAGIGIGLFSSYEAAAYEVVDICRRHEPRRAKSLYYKNQLNSFIEIKQAMTKPWQDINHKKIEP